MQRWSNLALAASKGTAVALQWVLPSRKQALHLYTLWAGGLSLLVGRGRVRSPPFAGGGGVAARVGSAVRIPSARACILLSCTTNSGLRTRKVNNHVRLLLQGLLIS